MTLSKAAALVMGARTGLVLDHPFFGSLALRLKLVEDPSAETAWTDGESLGYNPAFVESLSPKELVFVLAHEVMHCAAGHPWRRDGRHPFKWNVAADYAINYVLADAKFTLPPKVLRSPLFDTHYSEWIYARLPDIREITIQLGKGTLRPGEGAGDVRPAPDMASGGASETEWKQAVVQAAMAAKARGDLPESLERFAQAATKPAVDWRSVLHRFVQQSASEDYSWRMPSPRYMAGGLYLPSLKSEHVGPIVVAVDTSGSIDNVLLNQFAAELRSVVDDVRPSCVYVVWCDAKVHRVDTFYPDDVITFNPVGGGGTDFRPVFDRLDSFEDAPVCVIYLTDLQGRFPDTCDTPTLWAVPSVFLAHSPTVPFGETVAME